MQPMLAFAVSLAAALTASSSFSSATFFALALGLQCASASEAIGRREDGRAANVAMQVSQQGRSRI